MSSPAYAKSETFYLPLREKCLLLLLAATRTPLSLLYLECDLPALLGLQTIESG